MVAVVLKLLKYVTWGSPAIRAGEGVAGGLQSPSVGQKSVSFGQLLWKSKQ